MVDKKKSKIPTPSQPTSQSSQPAFNYMAGPQQSSGPQSMGLQYGTSSVSNATSGVSSTRDGSGLSYSTSSPEVSQSMQSQAPSYTGMQSFSDPVLQSVSDSGRLNSQFEEGPSFFEKLKSEPIDTAKGIVQSVSDATTIKGLENATQYRVNPLLAFTSVGKGVSAIKSFNNVQGASAGEVVSLNLNGPSVNVGTAAKVSSWASKVANQFKNPKVAATLIVAFTYSAIRASLEGKEQSAFLNEEIIQSVGFTKSKAFDYGYYTGDWGPYEQAQSIYDEVLQDEEGWDYYAQFIPWLAVSKKTEEYRQYSIRTDAVDKQIAESRKIAQKNNETDEQTDLREKELESKMYRDNVDYYINESKKYSLWESNLRTAERKAKEESEKRLMREQADFWAREKEKQRKLEAKERIAIAAFWDAYRKKQKELSQDNSFSKLGFGLL